MLSAGEKLVVQSDDGRRKLHFVVDCRLGMGSYGAVYKAKMFVSSVVETLSDSSFTDDHGISVALKVHRANPVM